MAMLFLLLTQVGGADPVETKFHQVCPIPRDRMVFMAGTC